MKTKKLVRGPAFFVSTPAPNPAPNPIFVFLFVSVFLLSAFPPRIEAQAGRGIVVNIKKFDSASAPVEDSVRLYGESKALVIGIDDYNQGWPRLSNAVRDARLVAEALERNGFEVDVKTDLDSRDLESALKEFFLLEGEAEDARLFVWFAGHGHTMDGEGYLIPSDAPHPDAGARFKLKALSMRRFGEWVRGANAKHALAVFDSCFSGTIFKSGRSTPPAAVTRATTLPVRQFLTSGDADQEVLDDGRFRKLFVRAINGEEPADLNRDGYLTGSELGMYLTDRLTNLSESRQTPRYGKLLDEDYDRGDFVFLLAGGDAVVERPAPSAATTLSVDSPVRGAQVFLDGKPVGNTTLRDVAVSPGGHSVRVEMPGYEVYERTVQVEKGRSVSLFVDLSKKAPEVRMPAKGRLYVETDPGDAQVKILNIGPRFYDGIELDPGRYQLEISASGYETKSFWVELGAGEDKRIDIGLESKSSPVVSGGGAGTKLRNDFGMEFVYIPPGSFEMGSPSNEPERFDNEKQHQVTLTNGFYMQTTEVTQGQWESVMGSNPSYFKNCGRNCPVEQVSWEDVQEFVRKLNGRDGKNSYRLPTEAEWEYAARAGTTTPFAFGDCLSTGQANYDGNNPMPGCSKGEYRQTTVPADSFSPNKWGLYNMHGNVWEWCQDWYGDYPSGSVTDPKGPGSSSARVFRGGSWGSLAGYCRSALRNYRVPSNRHGHVGFRLVALPGH